MEFSRDDFNQTLEDLREERDSHPINENYIDYGQRLGFFPVFKEQLENNVFNELPPSWKCYYFLLQSQYNWKEEAFYQRDADFAAMLDISLKSNNISKAKNTFSKNNWIKLNSGSLTSGGQRRATEYISVKWSKPSQEGKRWAKIDRATFLYLLMTLKDKPKFHDIIVVWIALVFINLSKTSDFAVKGENSFTLNKKDIAALTNQSQQKIKKALTCLQEIGFIKSWIEPKLNSYYIEHFTIYGHNRRYGYNYAEEEWFELVKPINEFLNEVRIQGGHSAALKSIDQAKTTLEKHHEIFDFYRENYEELYGVKPFLLEETTRIIQVGTLIKKVGADTIKENISNFFLLISFNEIKGEASISNLYNYLRSIHLPKRKQKKNKNYNGIEDSDLPF